MKTLEVLFLQLMTIQQLRYMLIKSSRIDTINYCFLPIILYVFEIMLQILKRILLYSLVRKRKDTSNPVSLFRQSILHTYLQMLYINMCLGRWKINHRSIRHKYIQNMTNDNVSNE